MTVDGYDRWKQASKQAHESIRELVALGTVEWPYESERELAEEVKSLRQQLDGAVKAIERSHVILADAIACDLWTKGAAINAESILRHALNRVREQS